MFWMPAPPEHSQYSTSSNVASKVFLEFRGTLDVIFYVLDACSARAFSSFNILEHSLQSDPGAQGALWMSLSMFWMVAPAEHSQYSKSYNIASNVILGLRGYLGYHFPCFGSPLPQSILSIQSPYNIAFKAILDIRGYFGYDFLCICI